MRTEGLQAGFDLRPRAARKTAGGPASRSARDAPGDRENPHRAHESAVTSHPLNATVQLAWRFRARTSAKPPIPFRGIISMLLCQIFEDRIMRYSAIGSLFLLLLASGFTSASPP